MKWLKIEKFVNKNLTNHIFEIDSETFRIKFNLQQDFYDELIDTAAVNGATFNINSINRIVEDPIISFLIRFTN